MTSAPMTPRRRDTPAPGDGSVLVAPGVQLQQKTAFALSILGVLYGSRLPG